jgi:hypothetical protein
MTALWVGFGILVFLVGLMLVIGLIQEHELDKAKSRWEIIAGEVIRLREQAHLKGVVGPWVTPLTEHDRRITRLERLNWPPPDPGDVRLGPIIYTLPKITGYIVDDERGIGHEVPRCPIMHELTFKRCMYPYHHVGMHRAEWAPGESRPAGYGDYVFWANPGHDTDACHSTNADFERYTKPHPGGMVETGYRCRRCGWTTG